jgi:glycosyltransferase involved in cell wall biosynthesis
MVGANEFIKEQFEDFLRARNLDNRIVLLGVRKDMPHIMLASDILLFPSREEALGMVAIESQAAGLPIIASNAVTKEVVVIDELIEFCSLDVSFLEWGEKLSNLMQRRKGRDTSHDLRWKSSTFNLEVSLVKLNQVYSSGLSSEGVKE